MTITSFAHCIVVNKEEWATQHRIRLQIPPQALTHQHQGKRTFMVTIFPLLRTQDTRAAVPMSPHLWGPRQVL